MSLCDSMKTHDKSLNLIKFDELPKYLPTDDYKLYPPKVIDVFTHMMKCMNICQNLKSLFVSNFP